MNDYPWGISTSTILESPWATRFESESLIHINNTNPILNEASPERAALTCAGIEVAYDGMDIHL